ncbi:MAG: hypothetical protein RM368_32770 [Nostoc sp. DedSLP03]|uniref:hypothetical protein n=1 Tax=Nostoc sp. DedSLP03 TaxID=3075400 RepID=UPI002AD35777|nr:hypothetical protein [Nostoc sp. DedSLP03]MDZ7969663.1 hypothetical protein [Nostoc sp. DedSLP03]
MNKNNSTWLFEDPPNVAVITSTDILQGGKPILFVSHDSDDGAWQFHTSENVSIDNAMTVALARIVALDPSIQELADLPLGWIAVRQEVKHSWIRIDQTQS